jgi:hypothetical protein
MDLYGSLISYATRFLDVHSNSNSFKSLEPGCKSWDAAPAILWWKGTNILCAYYDNISYYGSSEIKSALTTLLSAYYN